MLRNSSNKKITLSICIPTLNRAEYISETLDSITSQLQDGVEIVIVDGGSTDDTELIIKKYQDSFQSIKYLKKSISNNTPSNEGFDRDCNEAVALATGDYCWLMTDDDLIKPNAIKKILAWIDHQYELIVINTQISNKDISETLVDKRPNIKIDKVYNSNHHDWNNFVANTAKHLTFVGAIVIKRKTWLAREKVKYFGSGFVHIGVIFQQPFEGNILVTSDPLVVIRYGNAQWSSRAFKIWMYDWPNLIWSFSSMSDKTKRAICHREPWKNPLILVRQRVLGNYSINEFDKYIQPIELSLFHKSIAKLIAITPRRLLYCFAIMLMRFMYPNNKLYKFALRESWNRGNA